MTPLQRPWTSILAVSVLLVASAGAAQAQGAEDPKALEWLERAEELAEKGRYGPATSSYAKLAKTYPDTEAGRTAARRALPNALLGTVQIVDNGPSNNRVDIALMGDGYTLTYQRAFADLADDVPAFFAKQATFTEYMPYLNFRRYIVVSEEDNVDGFGREYSTALGGFTRGTEQGHVGIDATQVRDILSQGPEHDDLAIVFVRAGIHGSGSSGIACIGGRSDSTTVHEWGHAFGGLGDEYTTRTHDRGAVSERANVSSTDDPTRVPWSHWLAAKVPGVAIRQGAAGQERGAWKPTASGCVMERGEFFCRPCREALVLCIYRYVDPIDSTEYPPIPFEHPASIELERSFEFAVNVLQPKRHRLEVRWWIVPESEARPDRPNEEIRYAKPGYRARQDDRRSRGPLLSIDAKPARIDTNGRKAKRTFTVHAKDLAPGRYRVICRVRDTTLMRGQKYPWVLKDEYGLLESERAWWMTVGE